MCRLVTAQGGNLRCMADENLNLETMSRPDAQFEKESLARIERGIERILEELQALRSERAGQPSE